MWVRSLVFLVSYAMPRDLIHTFFSELRELREVSIP